MKRPRDEIRIETSAGWFSDFQSVELLTDLLDSSVATFEIGDHGAWPVLESIVAQGQPVSVYVNGFTQLTGRSEVVEVPIDADGGAVVQMVVRTRMADARYASAPPNVSMFNATVKEFLLRLYEPLGYFEQDFQFSAATERNLITGKAKGAKDPVDLEPLKFEQQRVNPPETYFDCGNRILKRFHMMHWDGADGRIVVGAPDDDQPPTYFFQMKQGGLALWNNVLGCRRITDWSEIASDISVFGGSGGKDVTKAPIRGTASDIDVLVVAASTGHFQRTVLLPSEAVKTREWADAQAARELAARRQRKDAWEVEVDGWSFWNGHELVNYAINTTCEIDTDIVKGKAAGKYLISRVARRLDVDRGPTTALTLIAPGIFVI